MDNKTTDKEIIKIDLNKLMYALKPINNSMVNFETSEEFNSDFELIACNVTGSIIEDVKSKNRKIEVVSARRLIYSYLKKHTKLTLWAIGKMYGGQDHTTVIHSIRKHDLLLETRDVMHTNYNNEFENQINKY